MLLDVREPEEFAVAHLENSVLMPMQSIPPQLQRVEQMADENTLLVLCHHGVRSLQVVAWLRAQGIENCYSVTGGIDRWSRELDPVGSALLSREAISSSPYSSSDQALRDCDCRKH